ncbi:MAG: bile acid:sodium symporter [Verrucomicrobia bacterium]|nr:bile acid:sodium symporter [Verrucomicrobiota bacterium]
MLRWKAHLFTQIFIFLVFPVLILIGDFFWARHMPEALRIGFFFLAVFPTTITSAIIYTSQAEGNAAVALFDTTVANIARVLITPLWMTVFVKAGTGQMGDLRNVLLTLSKLILFPFFLGQVAHLLWKDVVAKIKTPMGYFNQLVIVFFVFAAFSNSVVGGVWVGQGGSMVFLTAVLCSAIFLFVTVLCAWLVKVFRFSHEDQVAIFFVALRKPRRQQCPWGFLCLVPILCSA